MSKLLSKSFLWMFVGLAVTFLTGYIVSINEAMINTLFSTPLYWVFIIAELALVVFFSVRVRKMQPTTAKICFLLYSFVSGLTFSTIFILFELSSIMSIFIIAAIVFAIFGFIGYKTDYDLTKIGTYLLMALLASIICVIINIFLKSSMFDTIISIITLIIFFGFTAYDVQKIKREAEYDVNNEVLAINGAFELYLDFINIFIHLLELIGKSKD